MPGRVSDGHKKRVLADTTNTHNAVKSPPSAKKRKLNGTGPTVSFSSSQAGPNGNGGSFRSKMGSSQPKSHFETEVLEKMTQDINGLKENNSEKDQQWDRPSLDDFNPKSDSLTFQQIEIEEGTLHGGKVTLKMFGVSEVSTAQRHLTAPLRSAALTMTSRLDTQYFSM
jgi:DNA polymerase delta subunit 1